MRGETDDEFNNTDPNCDPNAEFGGSRYGGSTSSTTTTIANAVTNKGRESTTKATTAADALGEDEETDVGANDKIVTANPVLDPYRKEKPRSNTSTVNKHQQQNADSTQPLTNQRTLDFKGAVSILPCCVLFCFVLYYAKFCSVLICCALYIKYH